MTENASGIFQPALRQRFQFLTRDDVYNRRGEQHATQDGRTQQKKQSCAQFHSGRFYEMDSTVKRRAKAKSTQSEIVRFCESENVGVTRWCDRAAEERGGRSGASVSWAMRVPSDAGRRHPPALNSKTPSYAQTILGELNAPETPSHRRATGSPPLHRVHHPPGAQEL